MELLRDDQLEALADRLLLRVAEDLRGRLVPADDVSHVVGRDDGVDRRLGNRAELLLGLLALADVTDDAGVIALVVQEPGCQRQLDRELGPILAHGRELDSLADDVVGPPELTL